MEQEREYLTLLQILIDVAEANKGIAANGDDRVLDAEGLLQKFLYHVSSAFYLHRKTFIPDIKADFVDPASVNVLGRTALETLYIFHYVFNSPSSEEDKDFRYFSWVYSGLVERQNFTARSPKGEKKLKDEKKIIQSLRENIESNPCFKKISRKQQKNLLEKGKWRLESWTEIGKSLGLDNSHAKEFYGYLCGYAHAGNISVLQVRQAINADDQKNLCAAIMGVLKIAMAYMIKSYCKLFEKSLAVLIHNEEMSRMVDLWIKIGATSPNDIEIDWETVG